MRSAVADLTRARCWHYWACTKYSRTWTLHRVRVEMWAPEHIFASAVQISGAYCSRSVHKSTSKILSTEPCGIASSLHSRKIHNAAERTMPNSLYQCTCTSSVADSPEFVSWLAIRRRYKNNRASVSENVRGARLLPLPRPHRRVH